MRAPTLLLDAANRARCRRQAPARPSVLGEGEESTRCQRGAKRKIDRFASLREEATVSPPLSYSIDPRNRPLRKRPSKPGSVPSRMRRESWLAKHLAGGVVASGVLAADRLGDQIRLAPKMLVEGDGDLVGAQEGPPEVEPLVGNGRQDVAEARLDRVVLPNGHWNSVTEGRSVSDCPGADARPGSPVAAPGRSPARRATGRTAAGAPWARGRALDGMFELFRDGDIDFKVASADDDPDVV